jgi:uncharacterized protein (TIGR01777 family)
LLNNKIMNILILGGSGLIGKAFIQSALTSSHQIWVLSRRPEQSGLPPEVKTMAWDGQTNSGWADLIENMDVLINLAGENIGSGRWDKARKERIRTSRVKAGQAVVQAIQSARRRPSVLLQASAIGYYGPHHDEILDESAQPGQDFLSSICQDWENATTPVESLGVRRILIRTGIVLSRRAGALPRLLLPFQLFAGGPLGSGQQWWPWIHLQDQISAMQFLMVHPQAAGAYNLVAPTPVRMADFGRILAQTLHRPYWLPAPAFALRLLLGEMSTIVLDGQRAIPQRLLGLGYKFQFPQLSSALSDLF